jgi:hypothetical protein
MFIGLDGRNAYLILLTVLPTIIAANGRSYSRCSTNLEGVRAGSGCWLGGGERNKVQPIKKREYCINLWPQHLSICCVK